MECAGSESGGLNGVLEIFKKGRILVKICGIMGGLIMQSLPLSMNFHFFTSPRYFMVPGNPWDFPEAIISNALGATGVSPLLTG